MRGRHNRASDCDGYRTKSTLHKLPHLASIILVAEEGIACGVDTHKTNFQIARRFDDHFVKPRELANAPPGERHQ
jgi:hypothetical protein